MPGARVWPRAAFPITGGGRRGPTGALCYRVVRGAGPFGLQLCALVGAPSLPVSCGAVGVTRGCGACAGELEAGQGVPQLPDSDSSKADGPVVQLPLHRPVLESISS